MNPFRALVSVAISLLLASPVSGQAVRVVAVAEFADDSTGGLLIGAKQMNHNLGSYLAERAQGRIRVIPASEVRAAMLARGYAVDDLISPSRSAEVARAVGADWMITGRWTHLDADRETIRPREATTADGDAAITIRVVEATTRRILLEDSFWSHASGGGPWAVLLWAALGALQNAADRIVQL